MKARKIAAGVLAVLLACVAIYCAWQIISTTSEHDKQQKMFDELLPELEFDLTQIETGDGAAEEPVQVKEAYEKLFETYEDMVGYVSIADTILAYPVMQTPNWPNYYLRRNLQGEYSTYGVPYMNEFCQLDTSDNLIVYGHSMKNGEVFGSLLDYEKKSYWEAHPVITLRTAAEVREYTILGVFEIDMSPENTNPFDYNGFIAGDAATFDEYVRQVKARSFYDTGVTASYGEQLLTLSTCEYTLPDGRLVVVAVRTK